MQGKKAAGHHFPKRCCPNATRLDRRSTYGFTCRHEGRRHAHLAPRGGSTHRGTALAPGAQASTVPRRLYAERRLLHPAVAQRAAVDRKARIGTTKPADSEKTLPALSIPAIRVSAARMSLKRVNALEDALWRHPGPIRKHGPTTSPGSTAYASARRHRKTMLRLRHGLGLLSRISP